MAAYPAIPGYPTTTGILNPIAFAKMLLVKFYNATCLSEVTNTSYEGEIQKYGDTVRIRVRPDITSQNYVKGQGLTYPPAQWNYVDLLINQGRMYNFSVNSVDIAQADIATVQEMTTDGAQNLKVDIEKSVFVNTLGTMSSYNKGSTAGKNSSAYNLGVTGTPVTITKLNCIDLFSAIAGAMNECNVPDDGGRFVIIPPRYKVALEQGDLKNFMFQNSTQTLVRGKLPGTLAGLNIYVSNNLPSGTAVTIGTDSVSTGLAADETGIIAGHKVGLTFATQLVETELITNPTDFGKLFRSLNVYGFKTIKGDALVQAIVNFA